MNYISQNQIAIFMLYIGGGGAEKVMLNLAKGFLEKGMKVDLVLGKTSESHLENIPDSVRVIDLSSPNYLVTLSKLISYLKREKPIALFSALHYANEIAILAKKLAQSPTKIIVTEHNTFSLAVKHTSKVRKYLLPLFVKHLYPLADEIVVVSKAAAKDLENVSGMSQERIKAIYNPVITPELLARSQEPLDHPWFKEGEPPVILGVGKLEAQKDFPNLIRAFALVRKVRPARLIILGWGPDQGQLEQLINDLGLNPDAALGGYVANPYPYMTKSSVFVLSSSWEGLPTVLIEAMALGVPLVSTDCPSGPREILNDGQYGLLVPMSNPEAMAEKILEILTESKVRPWCNWDWLEQFKLDKCTDQYLSLLL